MESDLISQWIQYLKNNRIAALNSDPATGKLKYNKKVTPGDIKNFLQIKTNFSDKDIDAAIKSALADKKYPVATNQPAQKNAQTAPQPQSQQPNIQQPNAQQPNIQQPNNAQQSNAQTKAIGLDNIDVGQQNKQKKYNTDSADITDVEPKYKNNKQIALPSQKTNSKIKEEIVDKPGPDLSEDDVEKIFSILQNAKANKNTEPEATARNNARSTNAEPDKSSSTQRTPEQDLKEIKNIIGRRLSSAQRKTLFKLLNKNKLNEQRVDNSSAKQIFNAAAEITDLSLEDLLNKWRKYNYSTDLYDIGTILSDAGFSDDDIEDVMARVLDSPDDNPLPSNNPIVKLADYIKSKNLQNEIIEFLQTEFSDEVSPPKKGMFGKIADFGKNLFGRQPTNEEVQKIFVGILKEERKELHNIHRRKEYAALGRNKK